MPSLQTDRHPCPPYRQTDRQTSTAGQHSAHRVEAIAFILGQESVQRHGLGHGLELPTEDETQVAKGRLYLCSPLAQDNQPFVVLFSAGVRGTFCSRATFPVHSVPCPVLAWNCSDATRAGRRQQMRQEHSHITDGTLTIHHPLPLLSYLVSFQLQDMENP